jgi:hypothetical protein
MLNYKRIDHFLEWLGLIFQKREVDFVLIREITTAVQGDCSVLTIKNYLKTQKLTKLYECVPDIYRAIKNIPPIPELSKELTLKLMIMFNMVQEPFKKHAPPNRLSFFPYSYILHKFLEILKEYSILPYVQLGKSREKLLESDKIFENICNDLKWPFIPSMPPPNLARY